MILVNFFSSLLLFIGFYFIGNNLLISLKLKNFFDKIIDTSLLSIVLSLSVFLLIIYPLLLFEIITIYFLKITLCVIVLLGIYCLTKVISNLKNFFLNLFLERKNLNYLIFIAILSSFFLLSLAPITDADSTGYHLSIPEYYLKNENFPVQEFNFTYYLFGIGEILNLFALTFNLSLFISLSNFIGLLIIISILFKFNKEKNNRYFYPLLILSCPVLIPLINTAKPQFLFISLIIISFSTLIYLLNNFKKKNININFIITIICLFGITAYLTKISFLLGYFFSILLLLMFIIKNYPKEVLFKSSLLIIIINFIFIFPVLLWKIQSYQLNSLFSYIVPIPDNPGIDYWLKHGKNYFSDKSFLTYIFPLNISDITNTFGVLLFVTPILFFLKFSNKNIFLSIILLFFFSVAIFSQTAPRFYLEIYFLVIILLSTTNFKLDKIKIFKYIVYVQSSVIFFIIFFGIVTLIPAQLNNNLYHQVFSKYSNGYQLYKWSNEVIKPTEKFLTSHRSIYFSQADPLFLEFIYFYDNDTVDKKEITEFYLKKINNLEPKYILFWDNEVKSKSFNLLNFENCLEELIVFKNKAGRHAARNPFNSGKNFYPASIYSLKRNIDFKNCVSINN